PASVSRPSSKPRARSGSASVWRSRRAFVRAILVAALFALSLAAWAQVDPISMGQPDHGRPDRNPPPTREPGLEAPLLTVDLFSDAAGTRFRRSVDRSLPGSNVPFSLDDPRFRLDVEGPGGRKAYCYQLDARPAKPNRLYVFYDSANNYRLGQYPV